LTRPNQRPWLGGGSGHNLRIRTEHLDRYRLEMTLFLTFTEQISDNAGNSAEGINWPSQYKSIVRSMCA
jgi:hypothetical protein